MAAVYQEWLNQNTYRSYPVREDASQVSSDIAQLQLPTYLITDFIMTVPGDALFELCLGKLAFVGGFLTCVFEDTDGVPVCTLAINTREHTPHKAYALTGQGDYEDCRGKIVLGDLSNLPEDIPDGVYEFTGTVLEASTVRPDIRGVRSLQTVNGGIMSDKISGNIKLIEGANIRLTYLPDQGGIRIDAIDGAGFNDACECDEEPLDCIKRINGINVEDLEIVGDGKCVDVVVEGNVIKIMDTCSQPCCGCPELEFLTSHLDVLQSTTKRVEEYADTLSTRLSDLTTNMTIARKGV